MKPSVHGGHRALARKRSWQRHAVSFGILPGVLAEDSMTINIIPPKNSFCLCDITRTDWKLMNFSFSSSTNIFKSRSFEAFLVLVQLEHWKEERKGNKSWCFFYALSNLHTAYRKKDIPHHLPFSVQIKRKVLTITGKLHITKQQLSSNNFSYII